MAKTTPKKQNNRADPISKKGKAKSKSEAAGDKEVKSKHLYTDDNPETSIQGTGFKDASAANKTSEYSL